MAQSVFNNSGQDTLEGIMDIDYGISISKLAMEVDEYQATKKQVLARLDEFATLLFSKFVFITSRLSGKTKAISTAELKRVADGSRQVKFMVNEYELTLFTRMSVAMPSKAVEGEDDENRYIGERAGDFCGCLWLFVNMDKGGGQPFYQIYVFGDGYWYGSGPSGPVCWGVAEPLDDHTATQLAIDIIQEYLSGLQIIWRPRAHTHSDLFTQARDPIGFKVEKPG